MAAMAIVSLLRIGLSGSERNAYSFEHAMAHRTLLGAMPNIAKLSVLPYLLDPMEFGDPKYLLNHQQAHNDATANLPSLPYAAQPSAPANPLALNELTNKNLYDTTGNIAWWTFANLQEHLAALATLPPTLGPYPF